jgi:hypothetical protein
MQANLSSDAEAFEFLSGIVATLGPTLGEKRCSERRPFPSVQNVALVEGEGLPPAFAFGPVQCHDLSQTGISFYWPTRLTFESVVIALSHDTRTMYFMARVRHFREGYWVRKRQYLVGCEFQCRVRYPTASQRNDADSLSPADASA